MSIIFENEFGYYISHKEYIDKLYEDIDGWNYYLNERLFHIFDPYKKRKSVSNRANETDVTQKTNSDVQEKFMKFMKTVMNKTHITTNCSENGNKNALEAAEIAYHYSGKELVQNSLGSNCGSAKVQEINNSTFLFPKNCEFFCKDVSDISTYMVNRQFDLIVLDPPWWNKYIRRKRKKSSDGYKMMYNAELKNLPIETLLKENGLVVVWCTNSTQNLEELLKDIFPKWQVHIVAKWFWVKITQTGETVCEFSVPPGKQPYEKIIFGCKRTLLPLPEDGKLVVSIPSAIHSHKPPLLELLKPYLPEEPQCLEIFARYLLPNFTSYGNEVLRLQHKILFTKTKI